LPSAAALIATLVLGVLVAATPAAGGYRTDLHVSFVAGTTTTTVSGANGDASTEVAGAASRGVYGMKWSETADMPCYWEPQWRNINNGYDVSGGVAYNGCRGGSRSDTKTVLFDNPRLYVRGVAVCKSTDSLRVKGIKIYPAKVWATKAQIDSITTPKVEQRTNCGTWKSPVYCPRGTVATSVVFHHSADSGVKFVGVAVPVYGDSVVGIALKCQAVAWS